jgi:LuxR family transcriptional regulator, maltose regulon positive regulatory protein
MPAPILATKLYIPPPRPGIISRPHLIERLNEGLAMGRKLTLISASAGFGKTTLVSEWVADLTPNPSPGGRGEFVRVAWLSLDEGDNDPTRFLRYFIAALQTLTLSEAEGIRANIGAGVLSVLQSPQPLATESILTALLNEINALLDNFVFVLDDYHVIDSKPVDNVLTFLLEHLPPQMHLVITTREDPHLALPRLRARGQLTELRAADLRFTPAEAAEFLDRVMGLNLSAEDIAALETRTEGWIAGLQLAAIALRSQLSMQGQGDLVAADFIKSFTGSNRFVLDYLIEEVLGRQPENIQTFLLHTSILDRMCGPLCDTVLGSPSASGQEILEYLDYTNLFIVPLDSERHWYRYHHLFGELLRQRLGKPKEFAEFHLRASRWHEENGDLGAAFHHAIAAGDFVRAAGLAETAWPGMEGSFQAAAWLGWVKKLPEEAIRARPALCVQLGWAFSLAGEPETSEIHLQNAEQALAGAVDKAELKPFQGSIALARAYNAQVQGDLTTTVKYAEQAIQLIPENDSYLRSQAAMSLESTHWASGNLESAIRVLGDWMESMTQLGNHVFVVASAFGVADLLVGLGRLSDAERTYLDALQLAAQHSPEAEHITAHHHLGLSMIYRQRGEDTLAGHHLERAAELGLHNTLADWQYRWHVAQAQLKEAAGDLESAMALLGEAKRVYIQTVVPDLRPIAAMKARIYLKQGRPDKAQAWAAERGLSLIDEVSYLHEFEHLTLARLEIANPQVNALLARLLQAAEAQKRQGSALDILLVQALAHEAQGNRPQALAALKGSLSLAEPEGYVRIFVDEGEPMRLLIEKQSRNRDHPLSFYVDKLLAAFTQPVAASKSAIIHQKSDMIEPLSERELEVLKLLRTELSGPEIAGQLIVSPNTFRTHTRNIFNKLGVNNRRAAVRRAEELDLF